MAREKFRGEFVQALSVLRGLAHPCAPPIGVGEFDVLYVSAQEVVVWYSPVREGQRQGEVVIPCARLAAAWVALTGGATLDEGALTELGASIAGGRWLLALLALLPGSRVQAEPVALSWSAHAAARAHRPHAERTERPPKPRDALRQPRSARMPATSVAAAAGRTGMRSRNQPHAAAGAGQVKRRPGA